MSVAVVYPKIQRGTGDGGIVPLRFKPVNVAKLTHDLKKINIELNKLNGRHDRRSEIRRADLLDQKYRIEGLIQVQTEKRNEPDTLFRFPF